MKEEQQEEKTSKKKKYITLGVISVFALIAGAVTYKYVRNRPAATTSANTEPLVQQQKPNWENRRKYYGEGKEKGGHHNG